MVKKSLKRKLQLKLQGADDFLVSLGWAVGWAVVEQSASADCCPPSPDLELTPPFSPARGEVVSAGPLASDPLLPNPYLMTNKRGPKQCF